MNLVLILAALSLLQATLTLPGIAGIVLTMGMAVDANVLIYERIRDEMRLGRTPAASIEYGFKAAFLTIFDSNLTTLIAAGLLYYFGSGAVKGFAVTLSIGILASMFTAIMLTRLMIYSWARWAKPKALPI
jgi:preprotein translocase subunit SecD